MPVKDCDNIPRPVRIIYRDDPAPLRVNFGNFQQNNVCQPMFNMATMNCENAAPKWPSYSNVGPNTFKVNSGNTQNNRVFPFNFNIPAQKKGDIATPSLARSYGVEPTSVTFNSGSSQEGSDFQFTFEMPRQNLTTTPQWPAYSPVTPSTIYSKYPQGQLSGNLKVNPGKPSVYIFKGSNSFNEKTVSRIPRPAPPAFNAAASSDEKENTCSSQPFNFNLGASSPFDVNGALRPPSLTDFGFSASSTEKCKSRIPVSTASKTFVSTGDKENMSGPHLVAHTYGLSSPSHEKSNAKRPVPFTFGDSTSYTKNESAATSRIVPFTFTLAAPSDVKSNSKTTVCGTPTACTVNTRKTSTLPPVKFTFGASASPEEKGNSNRPAPYTFRGSASKEDNKNTSKMVPFTFTFSTPPVEKERTSMVPPFCFASKVPASSNQTRNLKLTLPAPLIFKTSTSPEPKENTRPPKSLASVFNDSTPVHQTTFTSRSASISQTTESSSRHSSMKSKEKKEMLTQGICMSVLRSPSNMCALRRGKRSQYAAVRSSQSTNDAAKQEVDHAIERQCDDSEETRLLSSSFTTATSVSPHSLLNSKRKHKMVHNVQDMPTADSLLQEDKHAPKLRCDSLTAQKYLDSSYDTKTSSSFHNPFFLKRKSEIVPSIHGVPDTELPSYWTDSDRGDVSHPLPFHPVIDALQQEESPSEKRRRGSYHEPKEVEFDDVPATQKSAFAKTSFMSGSNNPASPSSISNIGFSFVPATNFFQIEKLKPGSDILASNGTQNEALALENPNGEQGKSSSGVNNFKNKDRDSSCDTEIIYAGQKRKERDNDDYVPAFKRLRCIMPSSEKYLDKADDNLNSTTGESICYIERKPTADQKPWLKNQDTLREKDVISMAIRDKADQQDNKTAQLLAMLHDESSQQLQEISNKMTTLEHFKKSLIKRDSGYHECDEYPDEMKASTESPDHIDRSIRTPSPPPRHIIIPSPVTLEKRTITAVEDLFEELEEEEEYIKDDDVYKDYNTDEDDGRELIFVHREFKIRTGTLITEHRWALDDSSSSGEEETLCHTRSQPRNLFPSADYQGTLDENDRKDEIDDFFMSM